MKKKITLTGNELALAWFASLHAIGYWKNDRPRTAYARKERMKYETLRDKLSAISDHAYPYKQRHEDDGIQDHGDEPIMAIDAAVVRKTRARAKRFNETAP